MAKDYARQMHGGNGRRAKKSGGRFLRKLLFLLLVIALFVSSLFYLSKRSVQTDIKSHQKEDVVMPRKKEKASKKIEVKNASKIKEEVKFDFFTALPEAKIKAIVKKNHKEKYFFNVVTVKSIVLADHWKAKLTLLGFDVKSEKIIGKEGESYKISIGPYTNKKDLLFHKKRLLEADLKSDAKEEEIFPSD